VPVAWKVYNLPIFRSCPFICTSPCVSVPAGRRVKESKLGEKQKLLKKNQRERVRVRVRVRVKEK